MTMEDLLESMDTGGPQAMEIGQHLLPTAQEEFSVVRNAHKLILEGKLPFDETNFEFEIENPK